MSDQSEETSKPFPDRKTLGHRPPAWVKSGAIFFITICTHPRGLNQLCRPETSEYIFEALTHRQHNHHWHCRLCLLMPDHMHALIAFPANQSMQRVVRNFKEHTAKRGNINWQREFFDHRIRDADGLQLKANYIRQNPVRAKLTNHAESWPYIWEPR